MWIWSGKMAQRKVIDKQVLFEHLQYDGKSYISKASLEFIASLYGYWLEVPDEESIEEKDDAAAPINGEEEVND